MSDYDDILGEMEIHSMEGLRNYFARGGDANEIKNGTPLFRLMVEMYLRSDRFASCIRLFIENGLHFDEPGLLAVLANDPHGLITALEADPDLINRKFNLHKNAFTPLRGATLLHYCAEYGHEDCAKILLDRGATANAVAYIDQNGFGGHSALFHTACQHEDHSRGMRRLLLEAGADPLLTVKGIIWGEGYEWETFIPTVNAAGYAMMGLLRQFQRKEKDIYLAVSELMLAAYGSCYNPPNIPNRYLSH